MNGRTARREARKVKHRYRLLDEHYTGPWQPPNTRWRNFLKRKYGGWCRKQSLPEA